MSIEIGFLLAVVGTIVAVLGYSLKKANSSTAEANLLKQEASENASSNAKLQADVRYIRDSIDEIKIDGKATEKLVLSHGERITRLEESQKSAHKRLDKMEGK